MKDNEWLRRLARALVRQRCGTSAGAKRIGPSGILSLEPEAALKRGEESFSTGGHKLSYQWIH
jgi:hypothetical protein